MSARSRSFPSSRTALSLVEVTIGLGILSLVLLAALAGVQNESRGFRSLSRATAWETRTREMLARLENDLTFARGYTPSTVLATALSSGQTGALAIPTTFSFPDRGLLLVDRGTPSEERIRYQTFDPAVGLLMGLARGQQCTPATAHPAGATVAWSGLAEPIEIQINPPAALFDGVASEPTGPLFFRGDGTGFAFQQPTDPAGGTNFLVNGQLQWGATVAGQPTLDGCSALYYTPETTVREADLGSDVNGDGDRADIFDLGSIHLRSWNQVDPNVPPTDVGKCPPVVLQERCNWGRADLDADGFADPIFLWNPATRTLHIRLFLLQVVPGEPPVQSRVESLIFLRNAN